MRKAKLTKEEAGIIYSVLNNPANPQAGLSIKEVRTISPILDKMEENGTPEVTKDGSELIRFNDMEIDLKESEYSLIKDRLTNSSGWANAVIVRRTVIPLCEKLEELEKLPDEENNKK